MAKKRFFTGDMEEKRKENSEFHMLKQDTNDIANMPRQSVYKKWTEPMTYVTDDLNDNISGVDKQINMDIAQMKRNKAKSKL